MNRKKTNETKNFIYSLKGYKNCRAVMVVNGNISMPLDVKWGCIQGDPISDYLYILVIKIPKLQRVEPFYNFYNAYFKISIQFGRGYIKFYS